MLLESQPRASHCSVIWNTYLLHCTTNPYWLNAKPIGSYDKTSNWLSMVCLALKTSLHLFLLKNSAKCSFFKWTTILHLSKCIWTPPKGRVCSFFLLCTKVCHNSHITGVSEVNWGKIDIFPPMKPLIWKIQHNPLKYFETILNQAQNISKKQYCTLSTVKNNNNVGTTKQNMHS